MNCIHLSEDAGPVIGPWKLSSEFSSSIKVKKFLDQLSNKQIHALALQI
jgi:hypothetical protein